MKFRSAFSLLLFAVCLAGLRPAKAESQPLPVPSWEDMQTALSFQDIRNLNRGEERIVCVPNSTQVRWIIGVFSPVRILEPRDAVLALTSVRDLMKIEGFEFALYQPVSERDDRRVFTLIQLYQGIPVYHAVFEVTASLEGTPMAVKGIYASGISVSAVPAVSAEEAREKIETQLLDQVSEGQLVIYSGNAVSPCLAWAFQVTSLLKHEQTMTFIHAQTGEWIASEPLWIMD